MHSVFFDSKVDRSMGLSKASYNSSTRHRIPFADVAHRSNEQQREKNVFRPCTNSHLGRRRSFIISIEKIPFSSTLCLFYRSRASICTTATYQIILKEAYAWQGMTGILLTPDEACLASRLALVACTKSL